MSLDSRIIIEKYAPLGTPIPFQGEYNEWLIYPVRMNHYFEWIGCYDVLDIDKNAMNDIDIIKMSYLQFLITQNNNDPSFGLRLSVVLEMCLGLAEDEYISYAIKDNDVRLLVSKEKSVENADEHNSRIITAQDFDEIKRIILYQNVIDYSDQYIDPDVKAAIEEYYKLKNKGLEHITLEKQIACIQAQNGMTEETIRGMTVRGFQMLFHTVIDRVDYPIARNAEAQGAKFDSPIEHWAYKKQKDKFSEAFTSLDSFKNKISSAN